MPPMMRSRNPVKERDSTKGVKVRRERARALIPPTVAVFGSPVSKGLVTSMRGMTTPASMKSMTCSCARVNLDLKPTSTQSAEPPSMRSTSSSPIRPASPECQSSLASG